MKYYTEKNSNLIPQIDIPCFAWNSQAEQGLLFFKAKSLAEMRMWNHKIFSYDNADQGKINRLADSLRK